MAQPALHEVEGNPFLDTGDAKAMPQPFGARLGARDAGPSHDLDDAGVGRFSGSTSERGSGGAVAEAMDQIKGIEERGGHGHGAIEAGPAFLFALKSQDGGLGIHPIGGERQRFRGATTCIAERPAIGADLTGGRLGGLAEGCPLGPRELEAVAVGIIDLHASGGGSACCRRGVCP